MVRNTQNKVKKKLGEQTALNRTHLINRLELLCNCKDSLYIVVTQLLNKMSNGWIVLKRGWRGKVTPAALHHRKPLKTVSSALNLLHNSGSLCKRCSPSDTFHHLAEQCHPVCHLQQSGSQHQWRTPADVSHSSSQSAPDEELLRIIIAINFILTF